MRIINPEKEDDGIWTSFNYIFLKPNEERLKRSDYNSRVRKKTICDTRRDF